MPIQIVAEAVVDTHRVLRVEGAPFQSIVVVVPKDKKIRVHTDVGGDPNKVMLEVVDMPGQGS